MASGKNYQQDSEMIRKNDLLHVWCGCDIASWYSKVISPLTEWYYSYIMMVSIVCQDGQIKIYCAV